MTSHTPFFLTPLITPARLALDWREALAHRPAWARNMIEVGDPAEVADADASTAGLTVMVGAKFRMPMNLPPDAVTLLFEFTRYGGGRIVTNSNHSEPWPQVYAKLLFSHAPQDATPVLRLLFGASPGERIRQLTHPRDFDPANAYSEPDPHAKKAARLLNIGHAETAARERAPAGADIKAYVQNLHDLFEALDAARAVAA